MTRADTASADGSPRRATSVSTGVVGSAGGARGSVRPRLSMLANVPTLIFLGFVALTAVRMLGEMAEQGQPAPPIASVPANSAPGPISFGSEPGDDCGVVDEATSFQAGEEVWWSAELSKLQPADAEAVVIVKRDGAQINREEIPAEPELGRWDVLCSTEPVVQQRAGRYRVEVWNGAMTELLAAGEFALS